MSGLTVIAPIKFDANGNVLANLNAQNISPSISNPYSPSLLSHQTGLSATISTADTYVNIGSSVSIPKNGILKITVIGYVSADNGYITFNITRGGTPYQLNGNDGVSDFSSIAAHTITNTAPSFLIKTQNYSTNNSTYTLELPVLNGDIIQPIVTNGTANTTVYITDLVVIEQ